MYALNDNAAILVALLVQDLIILLRKLALFTSCLLYVFLLSLHSGLLHSVFQ
jgi:hypothetical protein